MHPALCLVAIIFMVAVEAADSVKITNAELIKKLQNDLKEKGNSCTSGRQDTLVIDGFQYTVHCNVLREKFFWAKASLSPGGPFWEYKVHLTPAGKLEYLNAVGYSDNNYSDEATTVYLQDDRPAAVATPPLQVAVEAADSVKITNAELIKKLQNDLEEKGNSCTSGRKDTLVVDGCQYTVYCNVHGEKFFWAKASLKPGGPFWEYRVHLTPAGKLEYLNAVGYSDNNYSDEATTVYLQDGRPAAVATPPLQVAVEAADSVKTTNAELIKKLQNDLVEKGNSCTSGRKDTLVVDGCQYAVYCNVHGEKFFWAKASLSPGGPFWEYKVHLTPAGKLEYLNAVGYSDNNYSDEATTVYLQDGRPAAVQTPPPSDVATPSKAQGIRVTIADLTYKMQNELKEKGNTCTQTFSDTLNVGGATFDVKCGYLRQKYFKAEAGLDDVTFQPFTIYLTDSGRITFSRPGGSIDQKYSEATVVYLKDPQAIEKLRVKHSKIVHALMTLDPLGAACKNDLEYPLIIGRFSFKVECSKYFLKYFEAYAKAAESEPFKKYSIKLTAGQTLIFVDAAGDINSELSYTRQEIYLKANYVERADVFSYKGTSKVSTANAIKERPEFIKAKLRDIPKRADCSSERLVNDFEHGRYVFRLYCDHIGRKNFRAMLGFKEGGIMNLATIYLEADGQLISTLDDGRDLLDEPFIYLLEEPLH